MKPRVRRPGSSAVVTASAARRRISRSGDWSRLSATSSETSSPSPSSTASAAVSSPNRRPQALRLEIAFSASTFSSGSESRWGR